MARRTVAATLLQYYPERKTEELKDVGALPDGGDSLGSFIEKTLGDLDPSSMVDDAKQSYATIEGDIVSVGNTILANVAIGSYGEQGATRHVLTHVKEHEHDPDNAHTVTARVLFYVPTAGTAALMFTEYVHNRGAGRQLLHQLKMAWIDRFHGYTLRDLTVSEPQTWLAAAQLEAVEAMVYGHASDIADQGIPKTVGDLTYRLEPAKGQRYLPEGVWAALRERTLSRANLLGIPEGHEPDEVTVTLGDGDRHKTMVLGRERTPRVRYLLCDHLAPVPDDAAFIRFCETKVSEIFTQAEVDYQR